MFGPPFSAITRTTCGRSGGLSEKTVEAFSKFIHVSNRQDGDDDDHDEDDEDDDDDDHDDDAGGGGGDD